MFGRSLAHSIGTGGFRLRSNARARVRTCASSAAAGGTAPVAAGNPFLKAGITSGGLSLMGDLLAQTWSSEAAKRKGLPGKTIDLQRTARMATFGLFLYGPAQHVWYGWLARQFPGASVRSFASKVALNQVALGPAVLSASFAWNLTLTGQADKIVSKIRNDGPATLATGWKFWVPASCINFKLVPLQYQVLYMSACGLLWTAYLSYASNL
mmetsp:Transcript_5452/g.15584  ORF Transcript_5452/g.15584 Transcript_5452/m.15584 type:complete len:211 (+) Transcript_5452:173-805(+)